MPLNLSFLFAAVLTGPTPAALAQDSGSVAAQFAAVQALEAVYGPRSQAGFGSAVFVETDVAEDELELVALGTYRGFLGEHWARRESAWRGGFRLLHERGPDQPKVLGVLGTYSFSLYFLHLTPIWILGEAFGKQFPDATLTGVALGGLAIYLLSIAICLLLSMGLRRILGRHSRMLIGT